jgi:hypothetical protein
VAFARFGTDSDVYCYEEDGGGFICFACELMPPDKGCGRENALLPALAGLLAHLERHLAEGHKVPGYALDEIRAELSSEAETDAI